jgi:small-conductance mechanosensitive channel
MSPRPSTFGASRLRNALAAIFVLLLAMATTAPAQSAAKLLLGKTEEKPAAASTTPPAPAPPATPPQPVAIPLPDVATRSEDLKRLLRGISEKLPTADQLAAIQSQLEDRSAQLAMQQKETDALLAATPNTLELREQENFWRNKQKETAGTRRELLDWANAAQSAVQQIGAQQPAWNATLQENENTPGLGPAQDVIQDSVNRLRQLMGQAQDQLRVIVNLQVQAANQDEAAMDVLDELERAREFQDSRLLEQDSLPLWQLSQRHQAGETGEMYLAASTRLLGIRAFATENAGAIFALALLALLSLGAAFRLHLLARGLQAETPEQQQLRHITRHWIALGFLPPFLFGYLLAPAAPVPLIGLVILISFVPILILLPPFIQPRFRKLLYCMAGVYALSAFVAWAGFSPATKREVQFAINLAVFAVFAYLVSPPRLAHLPEESRVHQLLIFGIRLAVLLLGACITANLFGYVRLAQFLGVVCLYSTFIAISMVTGVRVFTRLLLEGIDRPGAQQLAVVRSYRDGIVRWLPRLFTWGGILIWLTATVNLLGLSDWTTRQYRAVLDYRIAGGSVGVTLGGVLGFFLILLVGYSVSAIIRFLVREELLSRFHLSRGLPELIASTLHYLLLLLVFFFAVNAGGVELNKFTVLTGALGVGVGFGLQNIVNNFISGLILQFERPIHIGDVLDVDGTTGKVTRIGIRSSTVRTFQGAEVIIPNGNFISGKVINWTLSESLRRVELPVGVAYGTDPKLVCKLLDQAATTNENVLTSPVPAVFFKEFGESSLNFELQFWVMQESNANRVKSEVGLTVMELLDNAGIEIPFPQRDLRLRAVDETAAATLLSPNGVGGTAAGNGDTPSEARLVVDQAKSRAAREK